MKDEIYEINNSHPHFTTDEIFVSPTKMIRGFIEKNYNKGLHSQEFYEINIVLCGSANHYVAKRRIPVSAGDTFIIPPGVMHGYDGGESFDVYHILIHPKYLERNFADLSLLPSFSSLFRIDPLVREKTAARLHFRLSADEIDMLLPKLENLSAHSRKFDTDAVNCLISNGEAMVIIAELCNIYENRMQDRALDEGDDSAFFMSLTYLYENYNTKLTIETLARLARMSRSSYIEKFKRITGHPPAKFIRLHRVEMAKHFLNETAMTAAQIAAEVGFSDSSHLVKVMASEERKKPSDFRRTST